MKNVKITNEYDYKWLLSLQMASSTCLMFHLACFCCVGECTSLCWKPSQAVHNTNPPLYCYNAKNWNIQNHCEKCDCSVCANLWHLFALVGGVCCLLDRVISKDDSEWEMFCCQKKKRTGCGVWSGEVSGWIWIGGGDANSRNPGQSGHCFVCSQYWAQREGEKTNTNAKTNTWKISQNYQIFGANEKATGTLNISPNSN